MNDLKTGLSLQEQFSPQSICFGCGPANKKGLQIRSFPLEADVNSRLAATWHPQPHHEAFPGMLNGGIIGALLDCHSNWTACWHLKVIGNLSAPPCTVTAWFHVKLHRPTPSNTAIELIAQPVETDGRKVRVQAQLYANTVLCAECEGSFVAVKEGHPAYHRW